MPVFEFRDNSLSLTIAGKDFNVVCTAELGDTLTGYQADLVSLGKQITAKEKTSDDAVELCKEITDGILGAGAFEKIFESRTPNVTDCSDMLLFVIGEINEYFKKRNPENRKARRAAQKGKTAGVKE